MTPLKGLRVLDVSHVIAGPYAAYQLHLLGAEVIRVEGLANADFVRHHGGTDAMRAAGLGASFISQNAGKACIQINLKDPRGIDVFKRLTSQMDVVLENFRPGVMTRLGLGYDALCAVKPDLVYCSLTGYGAEGPMRDAPAYDHVMQGVSGLMSTTGTKDSGPLRSGVPITDYLAGIHGAFAMLAALYHKLATGEGQHIQVSMLAATLPVLGAAFADYQTTGHVRDLMGNQPFSDSPFAGRFDTSDGQLVITANTAKQADSMLRVLEITTLDDVRLALQSGAPLSEAQRAQTRTALQHAFAKHTTAHWVANLTDASVPAGAVNTLAAALDNPQVAHLDCLDTVSVPGAPQPVRIPGLAFRSNLTPQPKPSLSPPETPGQSTKSVLNAHGLDDDTLQVLADEGVIGGL